MWEKIQIFSARKSSPSSDSSHLALSRHLVTMPVTHRCAALHPSFPVGVISPFASIPVAIHVVKLCAWNSRPPVKPEHILFFGDVIGHKIRVSAFRVALAAVPCYELTMRLTVLHEAEHVVQPKRHSDVRNPRQIWIPLFMPQMIVIWRVRMLPHS